MPQYDDSPTGRQLEYATALGIEVPPGVGREALSAMIDRAKEDLTCVTPGQRTVAERFCIQLHDTIETGWECVDFFYSYMGIRAWVYSVIRHVHGGKWRRYNQSGLSEHVFAHIATGLMQNEELCQRIGSKTPSDGTSESDSWYRFTAKSSTTPEYALVRDFELPEDVFAQATNPPTQVGGVAEPSRGAQRARHSPAVERARRKRSGCVVVLLACVLVPLAVLCGLLGMTY